VIVLDRPVATVRTEVDLHLHSVVSDGDDQPGDLAAKCVDAGLRVVACTDHNSVAGSAEFGAVARTAGLTVVPGSEITARWGGQLVHCLAYLMDLDDTEFLGWLDRVHSAEVTWWRDWFGRAGEIGVPIGWADVVARFGDDRVAYLGDYLDLLLTAAHEAGDQRFTEYETGGRHDRLIADWCGPDGALYVPRAWRPGLPEVVDAVRAAGGVAVIAHPGRIRAGEETPLDQLPALGVAGLEAWTTWHAPADTRRVLDACDALDLVPTQGSDFHGGRLKPWAPAPGLVPEAGPEPGTIVDRLAARRG
jgi:predicted metal-dependent phosphoesterase TrpH